MDTSLKWFCPSVTLLVLVLMPASCGAALLNCSQPNQPALLDALNPIFNLSAIRPVVTMTTCSYVTTFFTLYGILGVDEKAQLLMTYIWLEYWWTNEFISWDPKQCGTEKIALPREKFWVPDIVINEFMEENTAPAVPYVYVYSNGTVHDSLPVKVISSCNLNIYTFPFDVQSCNLGFNSYLHSAEDIKIFLGMSTDEITQASKKVMATMGEWELVDISANKFDFGLNESEYNDMLVFHIRVKRRATMYVVNLLLPSCFLITVDLFSFLLPPQTVDRSAFKMTLILGYTVFLLIMNDLLPITGNTIPLINVFFSLCLALMVASLLETILITNLLCSSADFSPVPPWIRVLVLQILGRLVCLRQKNRDADDEPSAVMAKGQTDEEPPEEKGPATKDEAVEELRSLGRDLQAIRLQVEEQLTGSPKAEEWIQRRPLKVRPSKLLFVATCVLMHGPCGSVVLNCSQPTTLSLLKALEPVFDLKPIRPVNDASTATSVGIRFIMFGILGVDEKAQILTTYIWQSYRWKNEFISWDPDQCGSELISVPRKLLWVPDIIINEFMDKNSAPFVPYVYIYPDGTIFDEQPVKVVSSCRLDIYTFPFDIQNCSLTFSSYLNRASAITLRNVTSADSILKTSLWWMTTMGEWDLIGISLRKTEVPVAGDEKVQLLRYYIQLRRQPTMYVVNLLLPSCLLITVDLFSFLLPPKTVDRSSFKMTLILGYTVFLLIMNNLLPITGNTIPLLKVVKLFVVCCHLVVRAIMTDADVFLSLCLALMLASLLETIVITNLMCGSSEAPLPFWVRALVLHVLGRLVLLPPKPRDEDDTITPDPDAQEIKLTSLALEGSETSEQEGPLNGAGAVEGLRSLSRGLRALRLQVEQQRLKESQSGNEWVQVGLVIDRLLFCLYLVFVSASFVTIIVIWVQSYNDTI